LLSERVPLWEAYVVAVRAALPEGAWHRFADDAVTSSMDAIRGYLGAGR
jgi:hypothetical protein